MNWDYAALGQRPSFGEFIQLWRHDINRPNRTMAWLAIGMAIIFAAIILIPVAIDWGTPNHFEYWPFALIIFLSIPAFLLVRTVLLAMRWTRLFAFAHKNGFNMLADYHRYHPMSVVFGQHAVGSVRESLLFSDGVEIGNYHHHDVRNPRAPMHVWGFVRIPLKTNKQLPHAVVVPIDAKVRLGKLPTDIKHGRELQLKSADGVSFRVMVPVDYSSDVTELITPSILAAMQSYGKPLALEVLPGEKGTEMILYRRRGFRLRAEAVLRQLLGMTLLVRGKGRE